MHSYTNHYPILGVTAFLFAATCTHIIETLCYTIGETAPHSHSPYIERTKAIPQAKTVGLYFLHKLPYSPMHLTLC